MPYLGKSFIRFSHNIVCVYCTTEKLRLKQGFKEVMRPRWANLKKTKECKPNSIQWTMDRVNSLYPKWGERTSTEHKIYAGSIHRHYLPHPLNSSSLISNGSSRCIVPELSCSFETHYYFPGFSNGIEPQLPITVTCALCVSPLSNFLSSWLFPHSLLMFPVITFQINRLYFNTFPRALFLKHSKLKIPSCLLI